MQLPGIQFGRLCHASMLAALVDTGPDCAARSRRRPTGPASVLYCSSC
jgi:hypothetical protein